MIAWFFMPGVYTFFVTIFIFWAVFRLDSRIIAAVTLLFLMVVPLFLLVGNQQRANQMAVYVFSLLVVTVALQTVELVTEPRQKITIRAFSPVSDMIAIRDLTFERMKRARIDGIIPRRYRKP